MYSEKYNMECFLFQGNFENFSWKICNQSIHQISQNNLMWRILFLFLFLSAEIAKKKLWRSLRLSSLKKNLIQHEKNFKKFYFSYYFAVFFIIIILTLSKKNYFKLTCQNLWLTIKIKVILIIQIFNWKYIFEGQKGNILPWK